MIEVKYFGAVAEKTKCEFEKLSFSEELSLQKLLQDLEEKYQPDAYFASSDRLSFYCYEAVQKLPEPRASEVKIVVLTNAPFAIGLIGLAEVIPAVSLALYAGHVIDKSEKRKLLLRGVILYWCCALILLFLSMDIGALKLNSLQIAIGIYFIVFCTGIIRSFTGPSFGTIVGAVVPKNLLQNATTWSQGIWLSASVLGHAIVGFIIAGFGHTGSLIVVVSLVGIGYGFIALIKSKPPHADSRKWPSWRGPGGCS